MHSVYHISGIILRLQRPQEIGSQTSAAENILYCSVDVPACGLEGTNILRGDRETHIVQLLGVIEDVIHELIGRLLTCN